MPISTEVIVAIIGSLASPLIIMFITSKVKKIDEKRKQEIDALTNKPTVEQALRNELREEISRLRRYNDGLQDEVGTLNKERDGFRDTIDAWQRSFYKVKEEKARLEYELSVVRRELDNLKFQMEQLKDTKEKFHGFANGNEE